MFARIGGMTILTGDTRSSALLQRLQARGWGRMFIDAKPTPYQGEPWGFDNGAFRDWQRGRAFDACAFDRRLDRAYSVGVPHLAICPDIVAGGRASLEFSLGWIEELPPQWPWYLAVQNGMEPGEVSDALDWFDGILLGGDSQFKATAGQWADLAHRRGKPFHYARAGIPRRIRHAFRVGADSLDSAYPLWTAERWREFERLTDNPEDREALRL